MEFKKKNILLELLQPGEIEFINKQAVYKSQTVETTINFNSQLNDALQFFKLEFQNNEIQTNGDVYFNRCINDFNISLKELNKFLETDIHFLNENYFASISSGSDELNLTEIEKNFAERIETNIDFIKLIVINQIRVASEAIDYLKINTTCNTSRVIDWYHNY
jgi:hypothetical protein